MRGLTILCGVLVCAALGATGCESGGLAFNYYDNDPPRRYVHVDHGHICGPGCAHYWSGDRYVVIRDHVHGPGCGHVLTEGRWIVYHSGPTHVHVQTPSPGVRVHEPPRRVVTVEHVHGPKCGCAYDRRGSKWLVVGKDHVHGPGCGHFYIEGRWTIRD